MTDSERVKRQLYAIARSISRHPPPSIAINMRALSDIIELAIPEPGEPSVVEPGSREAMLLTEGHL